jgi:hypothetical protein
MTKEANHSTYEQRISNLEAGYMKRAGQLYETHSKQLNAVKTTL